MTGRLGRYFRSAWRTARRHNHLEYLPIRRHLRGYNQVKLRQDLRAGLNVALLAFPQGMAYAAIAGLPIQYGIYGSAIAAIIGPLFAGSRFIILGPTNATSVLLFASFLSLGVSDAEKLVMLPLVVLMTGVFLIIGSFFRIANLIQYISRTVATGYITAAAIYIIINQIRKVLGVHFEIPEGSTFFDVAWLTVVNMPAAHVPTLVIAGLTAGVFILLDRTRRTWPNVALTLAVMSAITLGLDFLMRTLGWYGTVGGEVDMLYAIDATAWHWELPPLRGEWISRTADIALVIAFLSILEGSSIGKSLAARAGERLDTNQEMFSMGMANIGCAVGSGMPASGSLTRSALNWTSGAATPLASIFCGLICAAGAFVFGPFAKYIPTAVLAVLVISIGLSLINQRVIRVVLNTTRSDGIVFVVTFLAALLVRLDFAIILGAATSILLFLRKAAVPELVEYQFDDEGQLSQLRGGERQNPQISIVHVEGDLFFGAADLFRDQLRRVCEDESLKVVVLKMRNAHHLDATSVLALEELVNFMQERGRTLIISEARKEVIGVLKRSGVIDVVGRDNIFVDQYSNPTLSTARALKRAQAILGTKSADVSIYVSPQKRAAEARKKQQEGKSS